MARKIIIAVTAVVLVGAIGLFAAEKAKENKAPEKPQQQAKAVEKQAKHQKGLLDELIVAYKANDKEKMGEIIKKMETRRDNQQKLAKLNKWHRQAHQRWAMKDREANRDRGRGCAMRGPGFNRGCPMAWNAGPMAGRGGPRYDAPCQRPRGRGMGQWGTPPGEDGQMPGPGRGQQRRVFGPMREWGPDRAPRHRDLPADDNPPEDLGW